MLHTVLKGPILETHHYFKGEQTCPARLLKKRDKEGGYRGKFNDARDPRSYDDDVKCVTLIILINPNQIFSIALTNTKGNKKLVLRRRENEPCPITMITSPSAPSNGHQIARAATQAGFPSRVIWLVCERSADRIPGKSNICSASISWEMGEKRKKVS